MKKKHSFIAFKKIYDTLLISANDQESFYVIYATTSGAGALPKRQTTTRKSDAYSVRKVHECMFEGVNLLGC